MLFLHHHIPVIITLEDHLNPDLRAKVAQMLTKTFGEMLFYPKSECLEEFPSPEELKNRIIISTKPPREYLEAKSFKDRGKNPKKGKDSDEDVWGLEQTNLTDDQENVDKVRQEINFRIQLYFPPRVEPFRYFFKFCSIGLRSNGDRSEHNQDDEDNDDSYHESRHLGAPAYKRLISIHAGKPKNGLKKALEVEPNKVRRLSLSEQALEKATSFHGRDVVRFTQKNFLRVYPKGTRVTSSNYKPVIGWMHGAQMVAFNMQGYGRNLWLMQGMFRSNGGCGYVKKPDFLLNVNQHNQVRVYMGDGCHLDLKQTHFDVYSPPFFYTRVGIAGVPTDEIMKKTKRKGNNWAPVWDEEFIFPLTVPELALLRIEVHEMSEKLAGQTCLPISELKPGIRAVPLFDRKGEKFSSLRLLMCFEFI
ncbi:hypothetical protein L1049_013632 [Liquidambar formosana]|uniref:Phosphoinositide phospholipase C n=1 Tax=Liquidambar formosana TaxID=63359 RepID=A0AAP0RLR2_LIQFO